MNKLVLLAPLVLLSGAAMAADGAHAFVRGEFGRSNASATVPGLGQSVDDNDNAYSLRGGYFFNSNFAAEAFYSNLYDKSQGNASMKGTAAGLGIVGKKNFGADNNGWFVDGRTGLAWGKIDAKVGNIDDNSLSSVKPYIGVGGGYDFNEHNGVSLNWDYQKTADKGVSVNAKTLTVGYEYRF
jgi:outer membrane protein W